MIKVDLYYNPYLVESRLKIDEKEITCSDTLYSIYKDKRIQSYINHLLRKIIEVYRDKEIHINFDGTVLDAEDVIEEIQQLKHERGNDINVLFDMSAAKYNSHEKKVSQLKELFDKAKNGPFEDFRSDEVESAFNIALEPNFEVNVIATMSSGKSTVVNAMLGESLMPIKNEACTAKIVRIEDRDNIERFEAQRMDRQGKIIDDWQLANLQTLTEWNDCANTSIIEVRGDILAVDELDNVRLVLVDTPGPNNSQNDEHHKITYEAITNKPLSMVLYVLNAAQLSTNDDRELLNKVSKAMKEGGKLSHDRFIFVINRIDELDPENGESISNVIENVNKYLKGNGIDNAIIIPASSQLALFIRMVSDKLDDKILTRKQRNFLRSGLDLFLEDETEDMNILESVKKHISPSCYKKIKKDFESAETDNQKALILSGIPIIEELLNQFLHKHAIPAKIKDAVESFGRIMKKAEILENLNEQLKKGEKERKEVSKRIQNFNKNQNRIKEAEKFRNKVKSLSCNLSGENKIKVDQIRSDFSKISSRARNRFSSDTSPDKANRLIDDTKNEMQRFITHAQVTFDNTLQKEFKLSLESIRNDYQKYVESVINKSFPDKKSIPGNLQKVAMEMPSVNSLVYSAKYSKLEKIGEKSVSRWWNPFTWGDKEDIIEKRKYVKMREIGNKMDDAFRVSFKATVDMFHEKAIDQFEDAKDQVLKAMEDIDKRMKEISDELNEALMDKKNLQDKIDNNNQLINWYKDFENELRSILSV